MATSTVPSHSSSDIPAAVNTEASGCGRRKGSPLSRPHCSRRLAIATAPGLCALTIIPSFFIPCHFPPPENCPALRVFLIISGAKGIFYGWNSRYIRLGWIPVLFWYLPLR